MISHSRRDQGAGAPSTRSWLLTVLGEFVLGAGGVAFTSTIIDGLGTLGFEEKAVRMALARSAARGWLESEKVGRRTRWHLTDSAITLLSEGTRRIYTFGAEGHVWDGRWLLVFASVPEARRELRYRLRIRLGWAGFGPMGPGAWLSPWPEREEEAHRVLADLGVEQEARSFVGVLGALGDPQSLVDAAWNLPQLAAEYDAFITRHQGLTPLHGETAFVALTELVHDWRRFPMADPDLPGALLPENWSGHAAAEAFHRLHDAWAAPARQWWADRSAAAQAG